MMMMMMMMMMECVQVGARKDSGSQSGDCESRHEMAAKNQLETFWEM